jgi:hypothetical protein
MSSMYCIWTHGEDPTVWAEENANTIGFDFSASSASVDSIVVWPHGVSDEEFEEILEDLGLDYDRV